LLPLVAALVNFLFGRWFIRDLAGPIASVAVFGSWVLGLLVFIDQLDSDPPLAQHLYTWLPAGDFQVPMNLYVDHLSATMLMVVPTVSTLVHIYAIGSIHGHPGFYRFFSYLPLFVFSMLMLVLADNYLVLFFFYEAVGLCSYLLVGFWFNRVRPTYDEALNIPRVLSPPDASLKAFVTTRVGDVGMAL